MNQAIFQGVNLVEFCHFLAHQMGLLRKIQTEEGWMPEAACRILDEVDAYFEKLGGDLDERKP